jgi:hypothetical protein
VLVEIVDEIFLPLVRTLGSELQQARGRHAGGRALMTPPIGSAG